MKLLMKALAILVAVVALLLVLAVVVVWMTVPVNTPWTSMLQQMGALPAWMAPVPMTPDRFDGRLSVADGYGVSLFATGISDARVLRVTAAGDVLVSTAA